VQVLQFSSKLEVKICFKFCCTDESSTFKHHALEKRRLGSKMEVALNLKEIVKDINVEVRF